MRSCSISHPSSPIGALQLRTWKVDTFTDATQLALDDVENQVNMPPGSSLVKEQTPSVRKRNATPLWETSPNIQLDLLSSLETSPAPELAVWSSAVGHASTGKSGRVIERLQGDIDRLHREKQLFKVRYEELEKANEALAAQNQYLRDRNSNYEQSHEVSQRQLDRKDRQLEELREELRREKGKTATAIENAETATASEGNWRDQASLAKSIASQKEIEYDTMVACRNQDNERHQGGLGRMKASLDVLLRDRQEDLDNFRKLEIVAEQQKQTIKQLEEYNRRIASNFKAYRGEIDTAITNMRDDVSLNDAAVTAKLDEMTKISGEMKWLMNLEKRGT